MSAPKAQVVTAIERGNTDVTRRVEVYEADGTTLWVPDPINDPDFTRLVDGSISVDYSRDERRTLDLTLLNDDGLLRPNSDGGLWYDKIIKIFRGVSYPVLALPPSIAIVEAPSGTNTAYVFRSQLQAFGFTATDVMTSTTSADDLVKYDIVISFTGNVASAKASLLQNVFDSGGCVVTISNANGTAVLPFAATQTSIASLRSWGVTPVTEDTPLTGTFVSQAATGTYTGTAITGLGVGAYRAAVWSNGTDPTHITAITAIDDSSGRWFDLHIPVLQDAQVLAILKAGINWVRDYSAYKSWEIQMGEFCIDSISEDNFPNQVSVTGRDYTKKCMTSKFEKPTTFVRSTQLVDLIKALAANAGISKFRLPKLNLTIGSTITVERDTPRWDIMKQAANGKQYDIYFDNQGYLVIEPFPDPAFGAITSTFKTGTDGNLVSYTRSTNDSRIYNHICAYGDPSDGEAARLPYFGEAKNLEPTSPTRINRIGDRLFTFATTFFTSDADALAWAKKWIKLHALESYELSFESIYYPWLEVGRVAKIVDPEALPTEPNRFLVDTIDFPIALGPMSLTAKRVTYVGDPNSPDPGPDEEAA